MKRQIKVKIISCSILLLCLMGNNLFAQEMDQSRVLFNKYEVDFGDLNQGETREVVFFFVNKGEIPFIISDVHVQCGCTAPSWPKNKPVLPGEKGEIKVVYDSKGKEGIQRKIITVKSNYDELIKLKIIANVITEE